MWLWAMHVGWIGFLLCLGGFIWRGCTPQGKLKPQSWRWIVVALTCFILWIVALPQIPRP